MATTRHDTLTEISEWLEERPELALAEHFACGLQADDLAADGFTITRNVGDLPTAFMAEFTQGEGGPVIGFLGEYDALPGLSQERQSVHAHLSDAPGQLHRARHRDDAWRADVTIPNAARQLRIPRPGLLIV